MKFEEAKKLMKKGSKLKRKEWGDRVICLEYKAYERGEPKSYYITHKIGKHTITNIYWLSDEDKSANDWEEIL